MAFYPLVPNWSTPLRETYEFKTDVMTSRDGSEQRRAQRNSPRVSIAFTSLADDKRRRALEHLHMSKLGETIQLPNYTVHVKTTTALPATGNVVQVASVPSWLVDGIWVALCRNRDVVAAEIDTVVGTVITFVDPLAQAWAVGTRIRPMIEGRVRRPAQQSAHTSAVTEPQLVFDVTPGAYEFDNSAAGLTYLNGFEVLTVRPNWADPPDISHSRDYDEIDYGYGRTDFYSPVPFSTRTVQATYTNRSADMTDWMRRFFLRQKGMRGEFWVSSWMDDLDLVDAVTGNSYVTVAGREIYDTFAQSVTNRAAMLRLNDGTFRVYEFQTITLSGSNTRLSLTAPLAETIAPSRVRQMSWLYKSRFASDSLTVEWTTDEVSQIGYEARSLPV
jgi:hypothetical protein